MRVYATRFRKGAVAAALGVGLGLSLVSLGPAPAGAQQCENPGHTGVPDDCVTTTTGDPGTTTTVDPGTTTTGDPRTPGQPSATPQPVQSGQTPLALTGGDIAGLAALGGAVIVAGGALVRHNRRGRQQQTAD
jgi:hypothetical protein